MIKTLGLLKHGWSLEQRNKEMKDFGFRPLPIIPTCDITNATDPASVTTVEDTDTHYVYRQVV